MMSTCEVGALAGISLPWSLPGLFPFLKHLVERRAGNEGALPGYGFKALSSLAPSFVYSLLTSHVYLSGTLRLFANCCLRSLMKRVIGTWFPGVFVTRSLWPLSRGPGFQDHSFGASSMAALPKPQPWATSPTPGYRVAAGGPGYATKWMEPRDFHDGGGLCSPGRWARERREHAAENPGNGSATKSGRS